MKFEITIAAIAAATGLAVSGCDSKSNDGKQEGDSPDFSDVKKETTEALKTTGEFIGKKAEEGGKAIKKAGEKAGETVKDGIDNLRGTSEDKNAPEPDPKPADQ